MSPEPCGLVSDLGGYIRPPPGDGPNVTYLNTGLDVLYCPGPWYKSNSELKKKKKGLVRTVFPLGLS